MDQPLAQLEGSFFVTVVLLRPEDGGLALVELDGTPKGPEAVHGFLQQHYRYVGAVGFGERGPNVVLKQPLAPEVVGRITAEFLRMFQEKFFAAEPAQPGSARWLHELYQKPDPRHMN